MNQKQIKWLLVKALDAVYRGIKIFNIIHFLWGVWIPACRWGKNILIKNGQIDIKLKYKFDHEASALGSWSNLFTLQGIRKNSQANIFLLKLILCIHLLQQLLSIVSCLAFMLPKISHDITTARRLYTKKGCNKNASSW